MFRKKSKKLELPENAPVNAFPDPAAIQGWYEKYSRPVNEKGKAFAFAFISGIIALVAVGTVMELLPLKQKIPFVIEVNSDGIPVAKPIPLSSQKPITHPSITYFSSVWVRNLLTIIPVISQTYLAQDVYESAGAGKAYLNNFIYNKNYSPILLLQQYPNLRAKVKIISNNFIGSANQNEIYVVAEQEAYNNGTLFWTQKYRITMNYTVSYPKTISSFFQNPIGFTVVNLSIQPGVRKYVQN